MLVGQKAIQPLFLPLVDLWKPNVTRVSRLRHQYHFWCWGPRMTVRRGVAVSFSSRADRGVRVGCGAAAARPPSTTIAPTTTTPYALLVSSPFSRPQGRGCVEPAPPAGTERGERRTLVATRRGDGLTDHQRRVWALVAEGRSHTEIARAMGSSPGAVKQDVVRIKAKLGVDTTAQLKVAYRWVTDR